MKWPTVEDATRRINILIGDQAETDMAARDLIVLMRELGRVTAENNHLKYEQQEIIDNALEEQAALRYAAPPASIIPCYRGGHNCSWPACPQDCDGRLGRASPPPPTQDEKERARGIIAQMDRSTLYYVEVLAAALRQRADEATRAERERCARMSDRAASNARYLGYEDAAIEFENLSAAIRARITPKGQP